MWEPGYDPGLALSAGFDAIIEPGDIAASLDRGATATRREEAFQVDPSRFLTRTISCRATRRD